jgi:ABC-2 type transport system permease protein
MPETPRHPLLELTQTRLLEFVRDPGAVFWTFGFPILLAIALGIAFRESPAKTIRVAIPENAPQAAEVAASLSEAEGIEVSVWSAEETRRALSSGKLDLVVIPPGDGGAWTYRYDSMRPESRMARFAVDDALQDARGREAVIEVEDEEVSESGGRYIEFLVPGLVGLNVMGSAIWGIGFSVVDARKRRLLKRLAATPMSRAHFVLAYMLSRMVFLAAEVVALLGFGWLVFDVPVRGSLLAVAAISMWGALCFTGVAMLIAARPRSTEAASGWANLFMLPMWLLGGSFFSYERFPDATLPFIEALPLTAVNDALRGVMNYGEPLAAQWPQLAVLGVWGVVSYLLALKLFRWQ